MRQPGENFHVNFIIGLFLLSFKGTEKFADDIQDMIGHRPNMYFRLCWKYISPIIIGDVFIIYSQHLESGVTITKRGELGEGTENRILKLNERKTENG